MPDPVSAFAKAVREIVRILVESPKNTVEVGYRALLAVKLVVIIACAIVIIILSAAAGFDRAVLWTVASGLAALFISVPIYVLLNVLYQRPRDPPTS